jgi:hypothetical protein
MFLVLLLLYLIIKSTPNYQRQDATNPMYTSLIFNRYLRKMLDWLFTSYNKLCYNIVHISFCSFCQYGCKKEAVDNHISWPECSVTNKAIQKKKKLTKAK